MLNVFEWYCIAVMLVAVANMFYVFHLKARGGPTQFERQLVYNWLWVSVLLLIGQMSLILYMVVTGRELS